MGDVNKLFVFKSLLTLFHNILPLHLKQTFPAIIWSFAEGKGDGIKSRLPIKIFSTLKKSPFFVMAAHRYQSKFAGCKFECPPLREQYFEIRVNFCLMTWQQKVTLLQYQYAWKHILPFTMKVMLVGQVLMRKQIAAKTWAK